MYNYTELRNRIFTDEGQRMFLAIRDKTHELLKRSGAARMQEIMHGASGSTWDIMACVDRLVELGEIRELAQDLVPGQHRVFVSKRCE